MRVLMIGDIYGNDVPLYYPDDKEYTMFSPDWHQEVGLCGEFTFNIPRSSPRYQSLEEYKVITLLKDGKEEWRGFIKTLKESSDGQSMNIYCLEDLAWLKLDMFPVQQNVDRATKLQAVISEYNAMTGVAGTVKTFEYGYVTNGGTGLWQANYDTKILDALRVLAGDDQYVRVRRHYDNNNVLHRYIDFVTLPNFGINNRQKIEFGENLRDFLKEINTSWMVNVINPYGDEIDGDEIYDGCERRLAGTQISNSNSITKYGRIEKNIIFNTSDLTTLNSQAAVYLNQNKDPRLTLELSAVDLSQAGYNTDSLDLGDAVHVIAEPYGIDQYVYITELNIDIQDLSKNVIQLSSVAQRRSTLTEQTSALANSLNNMPTKTSILTSAKNNAIAMLNGSDGGYVNLIFDENECVTELWITDSADPSLATKKWVWNENGLGYLYKDDNDEWQTNVAMTIDGQIVADMVATGLLTDCLGKNFWNLETGEFQLSAATEVGTGGKTLDDLATKTASIADVDVEYARNQSSSQAPESGWSTTSPQWQQGYYIWQRTKTTNGKNQVSYSTPVCIQGAKGETGSPGADGADGRGISSTTITYGVSNSASTQPSSWSSTAPTSIAEGKWLWVKTVYTYTDNSTSTTYSKSYIGTDGSDGTSVYVVSATKVGKTTTVVLSDGTTMVIDDGDDGTDGTPGLNGYVHTAWALTVQGMDGASSTTGFSTSVSEGKKYLGTYTDNVAADSSSWTDYSWSLIKGADGQDGTDGTDGTDGVGVSAIEEQYYLSTSNSACTGGSWGSTCPAWVSGKYIWTRSKVTWTDDTESTTTPILAQAENQANESVATLDNSLNQEGVFNRLTNNGETQGIYLSNGKLYINSSFIGTGQIVIGGSNYSGQPTIQIKDSNNNVIGSWTKDGITAGKGSFGLLTINAGSASAGYEDANLQLTGYRKLGEITGAGGGTWNMYFTPKTDQFDNSFYPQVIAKGSIYSGQSFADGTYVGYAYLYRRKIDQSDSWTYLESKNIYFNTVTYFDTYISYYDTTYQYWFVVYLDNNGDKLSGRTVTFRTSSYTTASINKQGFNGIFNGKAFLTGFSLGSYIKYDSNSDELQGVYDYNSWSFFSKSKIGYHAGLLLTSSAVYDEEAKFYNESGYPVCRVGSDYRNVKTGYYYISKYSSGSYEYAQFSSSDERMKRNKEALDVELSKDLIDQTKVYKFNFVNQEGKHYGVMAQEARQLLDTLGETDSELEYSDGDNDVLKDQRNVRYYEYIPHLINYVRDLRAEVDSLKEEIKALKGVG